tara:strand:+ start:661 stop:1104 length:444 start_codon:yes stop_codon:yes gene_type:complete
LAKSTPRVSGQQQSEKKSLKRRAVNFAWNNSTSGRAFNAGVSSTEGRYAAPGKAVRISEIHFNPDFKPDWTRIERLHDTNTRTKPHVVKDGQGRYLAISGYNSIMAAHALGDKTVEVQASGKEQEIPTALKVKWTKFPTWKKDILKK